MFPSLSLTDPRDWWRVFTAVAFLFFLRWLNSSQRVSRRAAELRLKAAQKYQVTMEKTKKMKEEMMKEDVPDAERRDFILSLSARDLHRALHVDYSVSCVEVILTYSLRALAIGSLTAAVTEAMYTEALETARQVDQRIARRRSGQDSSKPLPLEGLPISVKDTFDQRGADTTCGFAVRCFQPSQEDGLLLQCMREAGAIPFVRTNVPQALMVPESSNIIWGCARNPWSLDRTPGGSSGGEGALLAARGSLLGLGSDIGGSLRIPAHFCGITTVKPTPARMTLRGLGIPCVNHVSGQIAIRPVAGPMAHNVDDCEMLLKAWMGEDSIMWQNDVTVPRVPWREAVANGVEGPFGGSAKKQLTIGYYETDGWFEPAPACKRAVRQAVSVLEAAGHKCVRWTPPNVTHAVMLYYGILSADSAQQVLGGLEGEPIHEDYAQLLMMLRTPLLLKKAVAWILEHGSVSSVRMPRLAKMLRAIHAKSSEELYEYHAEMLTYIEMFTQAWKAADLDAVIAPGLGLPALKHGGSRDLTLACSYSFTYNLLHYPAGSLPIGLTEAYEATSYECPSEQEDPFAKKARETVMGSEGLPVNVQVVALPYQDEVVVRVMRIIEKAINFKERPTMADTINIGV